MKLPRVTLRDTFWLVLVVAMGVGWWWDRSRRSSPSQSNNQHIDSDIPSLTQKQARDARERLLELLLSSPRWEFIMTPDPMEKRIGPIIITNPEDLGPLKRTFAETLGPVKANVAPHV